MRDVLIIGAGPAGNIAALNLSEMGYKVAVIDWRKNLGDKVCTGIIGRECSLRFPPDASHVFGYASQATIIAPSGTPYRVGGREPAAVIVDRVAYINALAQRAQAAGAEYILGQRVNRIEVTNQGVIAHALSNGKSRCHRAEMLVLASGFGSKLSQMVGLGTLRPGEYLLGSQVEVSAQELDHTRVYLGGSVGHGSFGWLVPQSKSKALLGLVSRSRLNGNLKKLMTRLESQGEVSGALGGVRQWGIPLKPLPKTHCERVLAVGDVAGFAKPTTGGGIYYALLSGELAAETAADALEEGKFSARKLHAYDKSWRSLFGKEIRAGYYARLLFESLNDEILEVVLKKFASPEVQEELVNPRNFSFDWHSGIIYRTILHRDLGPMLSSLGPAMMRLTAAIVATRKGSDIGGG